MWGEADEQGLVSRYGRVPGGSQWPTQVWFPCDQIYQF